MVYSNIEKDNMIKNIMNDTTDEDIFFNGGMIEDSNNEQIDKNINKINETNKTNNEEYTINLDIIEKIKKKQKESKEKNRSKQFIVNNNYKKKKNIKKDNSINLEDFIVTNSTFNDDLESEEKNEKTKKDNPFNHLFNFLNGKTNNITDEQIGSLDPMYLLGLFSGFDNLTIFLNELFNNRTNLFNISNAELIKYLKTAYIKCHKTNNMSNLFWAKKQKLDDEKELNKLMEKWRDKYVSHWHLDQVELLIKINENARHSLIEFIKMEMDNITNKKSNKSKKIIKLLNEIYPIKSNELPIEKIKNENDIAIVDNDNIQYNNENIIDEKIKIPNEYYNKNLVDIQFMNNELVYIFNNDGKKEYYKYNQYNNFYYYTTNSDSMVVDKNICKKIVCNYKEINKTQSFGTYLMDLPIEIRHSIDYYLQCNDEYQGKLDNIAFLDIEVFGKFENKFPVPNEAAYPINAITIILNKQTYTWVYLDKEYFKYKEARKNILTSELNQPDVNFYIFNDEIDLLNNFTNFIKDSNIMYIAGWNSHNFDIPYIYNRMKNLNLNPNNLSPFNYATIHEKYDPEIAGFVLVDMLILYKELTQNKKESYSLDFISKVELGEQKVKHEETLDELYRDDLIRFLKYNIQDVALLDKLANKKDHIGLQNELRITTGSVWKYGVPSRLVDGIINMELIKQNKIATTFYKRYKRRNVKGAFVSAPLPGIHNWLIDLDAKSLYPSIILSNNIGPNTYKAKICPTDAYYYCYDRDKLPDKIKIWKDPIYNCDFIKDMTNEDYNIFMKDDNWYSEKFNKYGEYINKDEFINYMENNIITLNGCIFCNHKKEKTYYYDIILKLMKMRDNYKKMQHKYEKTDSKLFQMYNNKQKSIKVVMNSIYGVMGSEFFRFSHQDLVEAVTVSGKEMIKMAGLEAENWILNELGENTEDRMELFKKEWIEDNQRMDTQYCLYTDTDSIMLKLEDVIEYHTDEGKLIELEENPKEKRTWFINFITDNIVPHIQDIVNNNAMNDIIKCHNGDIDNHQYYKFKQEWIAKRAYFLNVKKQYALYLIASEGNLIDRIDYKGLEIERSDYPSITKKYLDEILTYILKTEQLDLDYINEFKEEKRLYILKLISEGNPIIAKPASFAKPLSDYSTTNKNGRYIGYPSQIYGMMLWNKVMYPYFEHGHKGYRFMISNIDFNKIQNKDSKIIDEVSKLPDKQRNNVCVPPDVDKLPEAFIVDKNKMIEFAWDKRIERLLDPLFTTINDDSEDSILSFDI